LETCGYPKWIFDKVVTASREKGRKKKTKKELSEQSHTLNKKPVVILHDKGLMETVNRIFWKYGISTAMKPFKTLRQILVHWTGQVY